MDHQALHCLMGPLTVMVPDILKVVPPVIITLLLRLVLEVIVLQTVELAHFPALAILGQFLQLTREVATAKGEALVTSLSN